MVTLFILIAGIYCIAGIMVHLYHLISQAEQRKSKHYILYTEQDDDGLEWYCYRFSQFSKRMGVNVSITLVSESPSYYNSNYISCLQRRSPIIQYTERYNSEENNIIYVNLNEEKDLNKLPF